MYSAPAAGAGQHALAIDFNILSRIETSCHWGL